MCVLGVDASSGGGWNTRPSHAANKFFASIATLTSIAIVAMSKGILAAAFSDAFQKMKKK